MNMYRILLVIDLQKQFKDAKSAHAYEHGLSYIEKHRKDYDCLTATVFQPKINKNYMTALHWNPSGNFVWENVSPDKLAENLEFKCDMIMSKTGYGLPDGWKNMLAPPDRNLSETEVDIMGCDADACVMAAAFNLWDAGLRFRILADYIYTTASGDKGFSMENIAAMMKRNFGEYVYKAM
jgi:nicotinamidase-related amidase